MNKLHEMKYLLYKSKIMFYCLMYWVPIKYNCFIFIVALYFCGSYYMQFNLFDEISVSDQQHQHSSILGKYPYQSCHHSNWVSPTAYSSPNAFSIVSQLLSTMNPSFHRQDCNCSHNLTSICFTSRSFILYICTVKPIYFTTLAASTCIYLLCFYCRIIGTLYYYLSIIHRSCISNLAPLVRDSTRFI